MNEKKEKIHHWSVLVGQLGPLKNSRSHLTLILCCSLPDVIPHIKFHLNRMKNAEVAKIRHWSAFVGRLGRSKNSRGYLKLIPCCSLTDVIPHIKYHLNPIKNKDFQIFEILDPQIFFENLAEAKLSKLEPFAWSH